MKVRILLGFSAENLVYVGAVLGVPQWIPLPSLDEGAQGRRLDNPILE